MKKIFLILMSVIALRGSAQTKLYTGSGGYFKLRNGSQQTMSYQKGEYEIVKDGSNFIGIRNVNSGLFITSNYQVYTNWRINDSTVSTVAKLVDSIAKIIYTPTTGTADLTVNVSESQDSVFSIAITDSLEFAANSVKSLHYVIITSNVNVRIDGVNHTGYPEGFGESFNSGLLVNRVKFICTGGGKVIVGGLR